MKIENILNELTKDFWTFTKAHISDKGTQPLQHFHRKLCRFLDGPSKRKIVMLPRGSFKTTISQFYKLYRIIRDGNISILSATASSDFARQQSEELKAYIMNDPIYRALESDIWRADEWNVSTRTIISRDMTHMSAGANSRITGMHPRLVFLDDVVDWHNSRTPGQRAKVKDWYNTILYLVGDGELVYICTPYHSDDCSMDILRSHDYAKLVIPAVISKPDYERLKKDDTSDSLILRHSYPDGVPIWENRSMSDIDAVKNSMLSEHGQAAFYLQMLLTTTYYRADSFRAAMFFDTNEIPIVDADKKIVLVDPAFKPQKGNCATAILVCYIGYGGEIFVLDGRVEQMGVQEAIVQANTYARKYNCCIYSEQVSVLSLTSGSVAHWININSPKEKEIRVEQLRDYWNSGGVRIRKGENWTPVNQTAYGGLNQLLVSAEQYPYPQWMDGLDCLAHALRFLAAS